METERRLWQPVQLLWSGEILVALFQFYIAMHTMMWELHRKYLCVGKYYMNLKVLYFQCNNEETPCFIFREKKKSNLIILFCLNATSCSTSQYLEAILRIFLIEKNNSELFKMWQWFLADILTANHCTPSLWLVWRFWLLKTS